MKLLAEIAGLSMVIGFFGCLLLIVFGCFVKASQADNEIDRIQNLEDRKVEETYLGEPGE